MPANDSISETSYGAVLDGPADAMPALQERFLKQPVDWEWMPAWTEQDERAVTIAAPVSVTGPGTFFRRAQRTLRFEPCEQRGWWFDRTDLPDSLPIEVSVRNVWTTARNIVLCSGSPHNYMRMVEHIVALKRGLGLDQLMIRLDSGDPPLFDRGSMDLVEALDRAGRVTTARPVNYVTVRKTVTVVSPRGAFLTFRPNGSRPPALNVDCAVDFKTAIGRQRIRIRVTPEVTRYGALARTNCSFAQMAFARTFGLLFADFRHLGYTLRNILVAGRWGYVNRPGLVHNGKSLEAVWHRAILDLAAALALIDEGRFVGDVISYRAGHSLDVAMIRKLYEHDLLCPLPTGRSGGGKAHGA